jgi:hypothetical protein
MLTRHTLATTFVIGLMGVTAAGPAHAYQVQDLRSPDAVDAGGAHAAPYQDLRSPDAADPITTPTPAPAHVQIVAAPQASDGLDWGSAAIGAGGAIGLIAVALGGGMVLRHRHTTARSPLVTR